MTHKIAFLVFLSMEAILAQETVGLQRRDSWVEEGAIRRVSTAFSAAYVRGDINAMMDCYAQGAVIMPGGADVISHRDTIRKYWTLPPGRKVLRHKSTPIKIMIESNTAYDYGYYEGAISRDGDQPRVFNGTYVIVWVKEEDGKWRMKVDTWHSVTPLRK